MISIKFFDFCDAPPIKKPSIELICVKSLIFFEFPDPPYKTLGFFDLNLLFSIFLIVFTFLSKSFDFGIIPVPIAQIG